MAGVKRGIIPALLTPFDARGKVNTKVLKQLVDMNINKGVTGFYCCGSTGEAFLLSTDERKEILETVVEEVNGRCAVIAHIGTISQDTAVDLAKNAESIGVDAISSVPPFYYNFSFDEIKSYYYGIVDKVDIPMIIYNFPAFSGVTLTVEKISEFLLDDRFIGIKHTSSDFYMMNRIKNTYPGKLVFNGYDEMFLSGLAMGADGGIGSTFNFMAEKFIDIMELYDKGRVDDARKIQTKANDIISLLVRVGIIAGEKAILNMMGFDFGECRKPFRTLTSEEQKILKEAVVDLL